MDSLHPYLPEAPDPGSLPLQPDLGAAAPEGPGEAAGTLLLVDDDLQLRTAMRDFLSRGGYRVLEARNAYDGLFLAAQHGPVIDLLITELNLLPVGGIKLAENVLRLHPLTQVLCMSACEESRPVKYWMRYLNAAFLRKPFTPPDLQEKVHELLARRWDQSSMTVLAGGSLPEHGRGRSSSDGDPHFWLKDF